MQKRLIAGVVVVAAAALAILLLVKRAPRPDDTGEQVGQARTPESRSVEPGPPSASEPVRASLATAPEGEPVPPPVATTPRAASPEAVAAARASSQNNMKQLAIACKMWAADHNGKYPEKLSDLYPTYLVNLDVLLAPSPWGGPPRQITQATIDSATDYILEPGRRERAGAQTGQTILAIERAGIRGDGGRNVLYLDGHVEFVRD